MNGLTTVVISAVFFVPIMRARCILGGTLPSDPGDRVTYTLALVDAREAQLRNIDYELGESCTNVNPSSGQRRFMNSARYEMRRLDARMWLHLTEYEFFDTSGKVRNDGSISWDGKVGKMLQSAPNCGSTYPVGTIQNQQNSNFCYRKYNELLGLVVQVDNAGMSLADLIRKAQERGWRVDASAALRDGKDAIRLSVVRKYDSWKVWLDPARGNMISRCEYAYEVKAGFNRHSEEAVLSEQVEGVWVPMKAIQEVSTSVSPEESHITYEVQSFSIGTVRDADLEISFPVGARVVDTVNNVAYFVRPEADAPDAPSHTPYVPPKLALTAAAGAEGAKGYSRQDLVLARKESIAVPKVWSVWRKLAVAITVSVAVLAAALVVGRHVISK